MKVNVIIPTYKPDGTFGELLKRLQGQTLVPERIVVMNTVERYFADFLERMPEAEEMFQASGIGRAEAVPKVEVHHLALEEFDHGGTRNRAASEICDGDIFVCMTQDAMPADEFLIENLVKALMADDQIAVAYGRQMAGENSSEIEKFTRVFNYPEESAVKGKEDLPRLGIKTFFCSNVCAAYKREIFLELGGFTRHTIFNEDMIFAGKAVQAGKKIAYAADARVYHSHDYSSMQQFHRNFDNGVSQAEYPEIFAQVSSESEGMKLVKQTAAHLFRIGKPWLVIKFAADCAAKYAGFFLGKRYRKLPRKVVLRCSMNRHYWKEEK